MGKLYVERYFPPAAKARMEQLVENLRTAYGQSIQELDWMSPATKTQALEKLAKFRPKIGYPDKWKDYSAITIRPDDLVATCSGPAPSNTLTTWRASASRSIGTSGTCRPRR